MTADDIRYPRIIRMDWPGTSVKQDFEQVGIMRTLSEYPCIMK
jgi:hypothetical protein